MTKKYRLVLALGALAALSSFAAAEDKLARLKGVPFTDVQVRDRFWAPRQETNRTASIPVNLDMLEKSGNLKNFELAAAKVTKGFIGPVFMDSDVYKALEAAAYSLATHPDPALEKRLDDIIAMLAAAQLPDGYLDTYYIVKEPGRRWTNLRDNHELYCAGHLFEAAVAHFQATGKPNFLNVATKLADHIGSVFGPGKRMGYPGHPEIELALVKLSHATGDKKYFELARFFIESRGRRYFAEEHHTPLDKYDGSYWQDDVPITEHRNIKGHAVRAAYLLSGATDVAAATGNPALLKMLDRVWKNTTRKNMYLTGGIGPSASNEGFTEDYDLPNLTAYQETCASVALAQWNHRLALLYGDAKYADVFERALYNGVLSGVSLDGTKFFYVNPLESRGSHHRMPWFGCACCPPNVARTVASLGGYAYAVGKDAYGNDAVWVNLYVQGSAAVTVGGKKVALEVTTDYPWDGKVVIRTKADTPTPFAMRLRVPGWCKGATAAIVGRPAAQVNSDRGYLVIDGAWKTSDAVELNLPMPVERVVAHPNVKADAGLISLHRGPLVYCLEAVDQAEPIDRLYVPAVAEFQAEPRSDLLGGVTVVKGTAEVAGELDWSKALYQAAPPARKVSVTAIPYYAWDNRKPGAMRVWHPTAPPAPGAGGPETKAKVTLSFTSGNCQPWGINDGKEPKRSNDHPGDLCHWWPHRGGAEWAQYTWKTPATFTGARVYWFDDTNVGACRPPVAWQVEYRDGDTWKPVKATSDYPVALDRWCRVTFEPVKTTALRLALKLQPEWAAGVHEWKVDESEDD
jgi:uncharacterized protein